MKIIYKTSKLERICSNSKEATKIYGKMVSEKLLSTLHFIEQANNLFDVKCIPQFNLHPLKGDRYGTYSIYLGNNTGYRLIIIPLDENYKSIIPDSENTILIRAINVEIVEVSKHYE